jgi:hypothetical protein
MRWKSVQLLEFELGRALTAGGIELFDQIEVPGSLSPYNVALACMDQPKAVNGVGNLQAYMKNMNATSSQFALGWLGVAAKEVFCSST